VLCLAATGGRATARARFRSTWNSADVRVSELLEQLRSCHGRRDEFAREWWAGGGKVVAYMCDNFPHELVAAAGMLPFRLRGDPTAPMPHVARYVAPNRSATISVPAFVDAMLEPLLSGACGFVEYVVVPHGRKAIESSYGSLARAHVAGAPTRDLNLFYLDKSYLSGFSSSVFDRGCVLALKRQIEQWAATPITDTALSGAIQETNRGRALLVRLDRLRTGVPPRLPGADALLVYSLASSMPRAAHNRLIEDLLTRTGELPTRNGPRIYVAGSPQPSVALYQLIESFGATVVSEDHCWGERTAGCPIPAGLSPLEGLAERYHRTPACSIEFPLERALERWQLSVRRTRPDGVLFSVVPGDELHVWDTPDKARLLAADGVSSLHLPQRLATPGDELRETIGAWLSGLQR
jgi:benzoyl-CoA reductase subunit C